METSKTAWAVISHNTDFVRETTTCNLYASFDEAVEAVVFEYTFFHKTDDDQATEKEISDFRKQVTNDHFAELGAWVYAITEVTIPVL